MLLDEVGTLPDSELSIFESNFTAATSLHNSSDGDESGYDDAEYDPTWNNFNYYSYAPITLRTRFDERENCGVATIPFKVATICWKYNCSFVEIARRQKSESVFILLFVETTSFSS